MAMERHLQFSAQVSSNFLMVKKLCFSAPDVTTESN